LNAPHQCEAHQGRFHARPGTTNGNHGEPDGGFDARTDIPANKQLRRSGTVGTNGQELFYEVHGDGPPLVLVRGIGYDSSLWTLQQVPVLSARFGVVLLDNRDAGRSSRADHPYTIADMADDVAGLLDALDIHRTHLLGLSMGSMIGMEFALRRADRLDRLVLAGPGAAPARSAVDPISIWNWVKSNDPSGAVFGGQQFTWLFPTAFLSNQAAVQDAIALLASNPNPVEPEACDRQARAYLHFDALDRHARWPLGSSAPCSRW
jgi:3-oxoadipate enol-lactonase